MFSLLNKPARTGKIRTRMCKILDCLSPFCRGIRRRFLLASYPLASERVSRMLFSKVGYRIAFPIPQPVLLRVRSGKD